MGILDKLKTVFFEEEYVEVEEPVKKKKEKEPIAKKIELPEIRRKKDKEKKEKPKEREKEYEEIVFEEEIEQPVEENILDRDIANNNNGFKFPMNFEEEDFKNDFTFEKDEITPPKRREPKKEPKKEQSKEVIKESSEEDNSYNINYSGLYEGTLDTRKKKEFKPTPIISPIYGILDKNYKKDEIVTKKEIRISSSPKNVDLDTIREKAYGDLASDITASMYEDVEEEPKEEKGDDNLLYDLNESSSPEVTKVTVGDAEEYYNDLGLEYNIDYKDTAKEKATGRRTSKEESKETEEVSKKTKKDDDNAIEDNLFDLIDSMYEDKE